MGLYRHNIKTVKTKHSRCLRDPDSPSRCVSARSWLTSSAPRRTRSSPDPRWSSASGPTSRPTSSRTPRTSSTSLPTRMTVLVQKCVLLLNSKPGVVVLGLLHHLGALLPLVRLRLLLVVLVRLAHHHDVLASPEWVGVELDWVKVGVRVGPLSLVA